ncbi:hypothetical protein V8F06_014522 [Rhypophila decipiens]
MSRLKAKTVSHKLRYPSEFSTPQKLSFCLYRCFAEPWSPRGRRKKSQIPGVHHRWVFESFPLSIPATNYSSLPLPSSVSSFSCEIRHTFTSPFRNRPHTTMALLGLPAELLDLIFLDLDPSFFRQDLQRLTVSKHWYLHALPRLWSELMVKSTNHMRRVANKLDYDMRDRIRPVLKAVDFTLDSEWTESRYDDYLYCGYGRPQSPKVRDIYASILSYLGSCTRVKSLRLRVKSGPASRLMDHLLGYIYSKLRPPCQMPPGQVQVSSIEIDLAGASDNTWSHRCDELSRLLPQLRRFRCCMQCICPDLIKLDWITGDCPLEEFVISLSVRHDHHAARRGDRTIHIAGQKYVDRRFHAEYCPYNRIVEDCRKTGNMTPETAKLIELEDLRKHIESRMVALRDRLNKARMLRIIWDDLDVPCPDPYFIDYPSLDFAGSSILPVMDRHPTGIMAARYVTGELVELGLIDPSDAKGRLYQGHPEPRWTWRHGASSAE